MGISTSILRGSPGAVLAGGSPSQRRRSAIGDPAATYMLTEPEELNLRVIVVRSTDGRRTAATFAIGTQSSQPQHQTAVVFEKYGETPHSMSGLLMDCDWCIVSICRANRD